MKIICLGTGCPEPSVRRASSGYLVEIGEDRVLLDCGGGVFDRLIQSGRRPSDITHIFFTHLHSDHMMDYARLVHAAWDEGGAPVKVFGPPPIAEITEKLFGRHGVFATDLIARTENPGSQEVWEERGGVLPRPWPEPHVVEIEPGHRIDAGLWCLSSCNAPHAQPQLTCMAFRLDTADASFVYTGDTALCDDVETLARGADLLIHWCYRMVGDEAHPFIRSMSPDAVEIAQLAGRCRVKQLLLTHLRTAMDDATSRDKMLYHMRAHFSGKADIAEDLMVIDLAAPQSHGQ
ncbi:MAG: MBL fold metallo-hydrolase [Ahrensia sp.]|nr:MBL fold metallo-hydrolase [Ahrensia sp.]